MIQNWRHKTAFYERVERLNLHGLHFQHVTLCQRRAWMYWHNINFAQWHERVATGAAKHVTSYARDQSTVGLFGLAPDRIDWKKKIVYENKGTAGQNYLHFVRHFYKVTHPMRGYEHCDWRRMASGDTLRIPMRGYEVDMLKRAKKHNDVTHPHEGQPQGIAPTINHGPCRGNPLWLPLTAMALTLCLRLKSCYASP